MDNEADDTVDVDDEVVVGDTLEVLWELLLNELVDVDDGERLVEA